MNHRTTIAALALAATLALPVAGSAQQSAPVVTDVGADSSSMTSAGTDGGLVGRRGDIASIFGLGRGAPAEAARPNLGPAPVAIGPGATTTTAPGSSAPALPGAATTTTAPGSSAPVLPTTASEPASGETAPASGNGRRTSSGAAAGNDGSTSAGAGPGMAGSGDPAAAPTDAGAVPASGAGDSAAAEGSTTDDGAADPTAAPADEGAAAEGGAAPADDGAAPAAGDDHAGRRAERGERAGDGGACGYPTWLDAQYALEKDADLAATLDPDGDGIACEEAMY
ncbi:MAG: hypothetical protein IT337_10080 [Thermomicrobiales bacterium]|nr:hypothetical protein [Thermomicrobiales bacterium]